MVISELSNTDLKSFINSNYDKVSTQFANKIKSEINELHSHLVNKPSDAVYWCGADDCSDEFTALLEKISKSNINSSENKVEIHSVSSNGSNGYKFDAYITLKEIQNSKFDVMLKMDKNTIDSSGNISFGIIDTEFD